MIKNVAKQPPVPALNLTDKVAVICLHLTLNTPAGWREGGGGGGGGGGGEVESETLYLCMTGDD